MATVLVYSQIMQVSILVYHMKIFRNLKSFYLLIDIIKTFQALARVYPQLMANLV